MKKVTVKIPKVLIFIVAFLFIAIIIKLTYISLSNKIDGINLHDFANNRNTKKEIIAAKRGNIYDTAGNTIASTVNSYTIIAYLDEKRTTDASHPEHVVDIPKTAKMLNEKLGIDYDRAVTLLSQKDKYQTEFGFKGTGISESLKNEIESLDLPGIDFIHGQKRNYSLGQFASYIVGYAKMHEEGMVGELGIESFYNDELSGIDGSTTYQTDAYGYTLPSAEVIKEDAIDGNDIYLTIDQNIQLFAETVTRNLSKNYTMDWMIFSVMDAKTGAIVASSTYPNFDPNDLNTLKDWKNPLVSNVLEPGSTMKIFSFASTIEEGLYNGQEIYESGQIKIGSDIVRDHNKKGWGPINFDTGFVNSSNVAASILAKRLGVQKLTDYYKKLGLSKKTEIELANEESGIINFKYDIELANAAFGQGIAVTPIQMLQALSTLTNDGVTLKPFIVKKIVNANKEVLYEGKRTELEKVYSKETMDYMRKLMHSVVYDGSSTYWQPSKTKMIGKTGTAQIANPKGGYLKGSYDYVRSFAGIFPEEDPQYIVYIAVKQLNSTSARPIANELTKAVDDIVAYLGLENSGNNSESKIINLDNYISNEVLTTVEELKNKKLKVYTLGTGKYIINQYPLKGSKVLQDSKVFLVSNNTDYIMEDITNWSVSEVKTYAKLLGITLNTNGYGYVASQSIPAGTLITNDMILTVELK